MYRNVLVYLLLILQTCEVERIIMTLKYSKYRVKPVIVNGEPVPRGAVPYIVSIKKPRQTGMHTFLFRNLCGGSIITTRKVLTAAHCFEENDFAYAKDPSHLAVVAGDLRSAIEINKFMSNETTQWRKISKVILHPNFNFPLDDIAVLFVHKTWQFSIFIGPVRLARLPMDYSDMCYAAGYGRITHAGNRSEILLRAKIEVMPRNRCTEIWEVPMDEFVCAGSVNADVAQGDSGGPLTCRGTSDPAEEPGEELLVGVTGGKNFDATTIYTRVSAYVDWIENSKFESGKGYRLQNWYFVSQYFFICLLLFNTLL